MQVENANEDENGKENDMATRRIIIGLMASVLLLGCTTLTSAERDAQQAEKAACVKKSLDNKHYRINVDLMNPRRGPSRMLTDERWVEVQGDTLESYLPYFGVAYEAIIGENKGLNFTAPIKTYEDSGFTKKGKRTIRLRVDNDEDVIDYTLYVNDSGSASIDIMPRKRESISFSGQMDDGK